MVSGVVVLVVVFPKEEDGFCASNDDANSFCACTPVTLVASKRIIIRNNSEDETTAKNVIVRLPFVVLREFVVVILSLLCVRVIFDGESVVSFVRVVFLLNPTYGNKP